MMMMLRSSGVRQLDPAAAAAAAAATGSSGDDDDAPAFGRSSAGPVSDTKRSSSSSKTVSSSVDPAGDVVDDERCGWGPVQPQCCQLFRNTKVVLFFLCCLATIQVNHTFRLAVLIADIL